YTDYRSVKDPQIRAEYARVWGVAAESLSLTEGLMVTEIVKEASGVRGMYIMGENPIISDPDIAHAEQWFRGLEFLAVHDWFLTADGKAIFVPVEYGPPVELPDDAYPFVMNTGRQLYHWHTGTMTRRATGLDQREPTPTMEIHPADAAALDLEDGDLARVTSRRNSLVISCRISDRVARGQVFVPFHFREAAANLLTNPVLDPYAKMAELKCCAV